MWRSIITALQTRVHYVSHMEDSTDASNERPNKSRLRQIVGVHFEVNLYCLALPINGRLPPSSPSQADTIPDAA